MGEYLWHNPFEVDQEAFHAMLKTRDFERTHLPPLAGSIAWDVLEPTNLFVTRRVYPAAAEGWSGNAKRIAVFHFLDGMGGVDERFAAAGAHRDLFAYFFGNGSAFPKVG